MEEKFKKTEKQEELDRFSERIRKLTRILGSKMKKNNVNKFTKAQPRGREREKSATKGKKSKITSKSKVVADDDND